MDPIPLISPFLQVQEPDKVLVTNKRKAERKQEYQHRNPPTQLSPAKSNNPGVSGRTGTAGQYLQPNKTKTAKTGGVKFAPKPGLVQCSLCSRNFAKERIEVHRQICKKTSNKKRKPFDSVKVR